MDTTRSQPTSVRWPLVAFTSWREAKPAQIFQAMLMGPMMSRGDKEMGNVPAHTSQKDLVTLKELIEAGRIVPVIDRRYPLSETAEALRYLGAGHARGKVIITVI